MKRNGFRLITWLLLLSVALASLVGCSTKKNDSPSFTPLSPEDGDAEQAAEGSAAQSYDGPERPALWKVTDEGSGNVMYLFGSIHIGDESTFPLDPEIMAAFEACDTLAVEVDMLPYLESPLKAAGIAAYMVYDDGSSITDEIDADLFQQVMDLLAAENADLGMTAELAQMYRPYMFVSLLTDLGVQKAGFSSDLGVDTHLLQLAREREMEVLEIESMDSQMELLTSFPATLQSLLLEQALQLEESAAGMRELYSAWERGDVNALVATLDTEEVDEEEMDLLEGYNTALIHDRNTLMSDVAEEYMEDGLNVFYVVGALHMVGEDGIVQQMMERGYLVERI